MGVHEEDGVTGRMGVHKEDERSDSGERRYTAIHALMPVSECVGTPSQTF